MTISVSNNTPRVSYTVSEGATQTSFTVNFEFFADADLNVFVDNTLKTITTHYTVSGGNGSTGTVTMSVTGASGGSTVVITRDIALERTTDFPTQGAFNISSLNTELDKLVAIDADVDDTIARSIRLQDSDASASMELPLKASRVGTVLGFNATTGAVEAGPTIANVNSLADITANINTVAGIQANVTTVAGISSNVTTVAGISSAVSSVAGALSNINTLAASDVITDMSLLATTDVIADMALLANADVISDMNTLAVTDVINDINTLATSDIVSDLNTLATSDIVSDINTLATSDIVSDLNTLATSDIVSDINTLATSDIVTDLNLLATSDFVSDLNTLATTTNVNNISTVAGISSNISTVAGISSNVTTVAGIQANVTSVAGIASNVTTVANNLSGVTSFAERYRVASSAPTSSLDVGDLYFDTTANELKVYKSSGWSAAGSTVNGTSARFTYNISGTPTAVTGADANGNTLAYDAGFIDVYLNGVKMLNGTDVTVTSGDTVTFASALANGDLVDIVAFGTFSVANIVSTGALNSGSITSGFGNIDTGSSTITTTGAITGGSLVADNITIDGTEIDLSSGSLTIDVASEIILDTGGGAIKFNNAGAENGRFYFGSNNLYMYNPVQDTDIIFQGNDGGSTVTALTLDMSNGGRANFNNDIGLNDDRGVRFGSNDDSVIYNDNSNLYIKNSTTNQDIIFQGNDDGSTITALTLDMSNEGAANFNSFIYLNYIRGNNDNNTGINITGSDVLAFQTGGSERMRIDSDGHVLVGKTTTAVNTQGIQLGSNGRFFATSDGAETGVFNRKTSDGDIVDFRKDNTTVGSIGNIGSAPAFRNTNEDGISVLTDNGRAILVSTNNSGLQDDDGQIGTASYRWNKAYIKDGVTTGSDQNEKQNIENLTSKELNVANKLSALFKTYKWKDSVVEKGDKARTHTGIIAQDIQSAFSAEGLDASDYGMFMSDTWTNDDGKEQTRLGVRYPELFSFIFSSIEARLTALESK